MKPTDLLRKSLALIASLILVALVAAAEYYGRPISFSIFYLLAIFFCVHNVGRWPGIVLAVVCGATWLVMELNFNPIYSDRGHSVNRVDPMIGYWNGFALTGVFVIFAVLVASLESALQREKRINQNLETLLTLSPSDSRGWLAEPTPSPSAEPSPPPEVQQTPQEG